MVISKLESKDVVKDKDKEQKESAEDLEKEDLEFQKKHTNLLYKLMKYNPFDPLNDLVRSILDKFNLLDKFGHLQWWAAYIWVRESMRKLWNFKYDWVDGNLFPEYGGGILISNHQSHLDPFFVAGATTRRIHWMSKDENFKTPIMRSLFTNLSAFEVKRDIKDKEAWNEALRILEKDQWVGIFPEGTRSKDGSIGEFKTGAIRLAIETGQPIVPAAVIGSRNALPKGKLVMKPVQVKVRVAEPIYYDEYDIDTVSYKKIRELTEELQKIVVSLKNGTYNKDSDYHVEELSIGSPDTAEESIKKFNIMDRIKTFGKDTLQLIDDIWYSILRGAEAFDLKEHFQEAIYHFSGNVVNTMCDIMLPYRTIDYDDHIPEEGGAVICSNHNSEWDVIILATTFQQRGQVVYQMAKESLFKIPIVNAWVRTCHAFPLRRDAHDEGSYKYARELLENGERVIVYPEGTTNPGNGQLLEGHTGAIRLAIEAKVPIILVGITGTEDVYPKHAKMLNFGKGCILKAGELFTEHEQYFDKPMPDYKELKRLTDNMMARIKELTFYDDPTA